MNLIKTIIMTVALVAVSAPVLAQEADTDSTSAVEIVGNSSDLMPVENTQELVELMLYVDRYYHVKVQNDYVANAKPAVAKVLRKGKSAKETNKNLFGSFQLVLAGRGEFVPEQTQTKMLTYMVDHQCSYTEDAKEWQGECVELWQRVKNVAMVAVKKLPENDFRANAEHSIADASEYAEYTDEEGKTIYFNGSIGDSIILIHGTLAAINFQLSEEDRPWKGLGLDSKTEGTDDLKNRAEFLIGQEVCVYADEIQCNKVTDVTENGIIVGKTLVVWKDAEKAMVLGTLPESFLSGAKNPNHGFQLGLSIDWVMTSSEGLTAAHSVNSSVMAQYNFRNVPLALRLGVGISDIVSGGLADHYLSKTLKRDRVAGQFTLGLGFVPMFTKTVGLTVMANGIVTTKGGKGANVEAGPSFYLGKKIVLSPMVGFGYMDHDMVLGDNKWSPLANPSVKGFTLNAGLNAAYRF